MPDIEVSVGDRFPRPEDYDPSRHRYREAYVHPQEWGVTLSACKGLPSETIILPPEHEPGGSDKPVRITIYKTPRDLRAYVWQLKDEDGSTLEFRSEGPPGQVPCQVQGKVRKTGRFEVSLTEEFIDRGQQTTRTSWTLRDFLVVCLGDSCASGEGNPSHWGEPNTRGRIKCENTTLSLLTGTDIPMEREARWVEPLAHRSYNSGHARGSRSAQVPKGGVAITFLSFATSGAEIEKGLLQPQHSWQNGGQIEEARRAVGNRPIDALLLSIGGNDVGFSSGLRTLASDFRGGGLEKMERETRRRIRELEEKYDRLATEIQSSLSPRKILITEYPTALFDKEDKLGGPLGRRAEGCGVFDTSMYMQVSAVDAGHIFDLAHQLNEQIRLAADRQGWIYVGGIVEGFAGHGYCMGDSSFFIGAEESCLHQGDFDGTMHPNFFGHRVYERSVATSLRAHLMEILPVQKWLVPVLTSTMS